MEESLSFQQLEWDLETVLNEPMMVERENFLTRVTFNSMSHVSFEHDRSMVGHVEIQVGWVKIRKGVQPGRVGHNSVQSLQHNIREIPLIIPGEFWAIWIQTREIVIAESIYEIIDKSKGPRIASLLLIVVEDFVEVPTYKLTNIRVSVGGRNHTKKVPRVNTITLFRVSIKSGEVKGKQMRVNKTVDVALRVRQDRNIDIFIP